MCLKIKLKYIFLGSVLDTSVLVLLDRLKGLCDGADVPIETFHDHEVVFILKEFSCKFFTIHFYVFYLDIK